MDPAEMDKKLFPVLARYFEVDGDAIFNPGTLSTLAQDWIVAEIRRHEVGFQDELKLALTSSKEQVKASAPGTFHYLGYDTAVALSGLLSDIRDLTCWRLHNQELFAPEVSRLYEETHEKQLMSLHELIPKSVLTGEDLEQTKKSVDTQFADLAHWLKTALVDTNEDPSRFAAIDETTAALERALTAQEHKNAIAQKAKALTEVLED